jgi:two-component system, NtrC family, sensor kinase
MLYCCIHKRPIVSYLQGQSVTAFLDKLPTILVLAVLVGIFLSLRKHAPSARVGLWTCAWALIFLHFFVEAFETHTGTIEKIVESIDLGALELSGVVFVASLIISVENRAKRLMLLSILGVPAAFHAVAVTFGWNIPVILSASLAIFFFGGAAFAILAPTRTTLFQFSVVAVSSGAGIWAVRDQLRGNSDFGILAILTLTFGLCGFLFWNRYPRFSPGVIAVTAGFISWGAVFPVATILAAIAPKLQMNPELWNVPKFFVAFGMVLALVEDKSRIIQAAHARQRAENRLLQSLSQITSHLLAGKDPAALCGEIAVAITSATSFRKAAVMLAHENGPLHVAGISGYDPVEVEQLLERAAFSTTEKLKNLCISGNRIGNNSFRASRVEAEILIPLISSHGSYLGCLWLSGSASASGAEPSEVMQLEVLATDVAVTMENSRLHHRLARSEKLAALGQLVAGVAHELNNPLTGILGYSELLSEEVEKPAVAARIQKLANEARRMKRIVEGLLRFARQNNPATRAAGLEAALRDVVQLREYHLRKLGIHIEIDVPPVLPSIAIGEDELKQVLLNLLNNAIDAIEESAQREIFIHASRRGDKVVIEFDDSGPGFSDLNRAFDPFYTTKPVGKGTGLGLSICYGIAQECGGEITLANKEPYGASVLLELPISAALPAVLSA